MLRALYNFKAPYENTLSFSENDLFVVLKRNNKDHDWIHVVNLKGINGYAPVNYLTSAGCTKNDEIQHIKQILTHIPTSHTTHARNTVVENLIDLQKRLEEELQTTAAAQLYNVCAIIQRNTGCNFEEAKSACRETLNFLQETVLPTQSGLERMLQINVDQIALEIRQSCGNMPSRIHDLISIILEEASDQETVVPEETWEGFLDVVTRADPALCTNALEKHDCTLLLRLIQRLQSEANWKKRNIILAILHKSLQLSPKFMNVALNSILPEELSRDIITSYSIGSVSKDRIAWSVQVLTLTLCASERLSFNHQQELGERLIDPLLDILENGSKQKDDDSNECEALKEIIKLVLALYRQFAECLPYENPVLTSVAKQSACDFLIERIILLYNREVNPLKEYLTKNGEPDVVCRLLIGLFSNPNTARLFYTADVNVVLDIILRQLEDYGSGEKVRSDALDLYYAVRKNCSHSYKTDAFVKVLKVILEESVPILQPNQKEAERDRLTVVKLCHEFPELLMK